MSDVYFDCINVLAMFFVGHKFVSCEMHKNSKDCFGSVFFCFVKMIILPRRYSVFVLQECFVKGVTMFNHEPTWDNNLQCLIYTKRSGLLHGFQGPLKFGFVCQLIFTHFFLLFFLPSLIVCT